MFLNKRASVKKKDHNSLKKLILNRFQQKKFSILLKRVKTQFHSLNRIRFLKNKLPIYLLKINNELFSHRSNGRERFLKKDFLLTKIFQLNVLIAQLQTKGFSAKNYSLLSYEFGSKKNAAKTKLFLENLQLQNVLKSKLNKITRKKKFSYRFYQLYI